MPSVTIQRLKCFVAKKNVLRHSLTLSIKKLLFDRGVFRYPLKTVLHYVFCCASCRRIKQNAKSSNHFRWHMLYDQGEGKLQEELDCITFLKTIRQLKLLTQVLLTRKQKLMLRFQKANVLDSETSSSDSDKGGGQQLLKQLQGGDPQEKTAA